MALFKRGPLEANFYYSIDAMKYAISLLILLTLTISALGNGSELVVVGVPAPEFELPDQTGQLHSLEDYRDRWVVLYFYPKTRLRAVLRRHASFGTAYSRFDK